MAGEASYTLLPDCDTTDTTRYWSTSISEIKEFKFPPEGHCIYRAPSILREIDPDAYTPQVVLIGPLHYAKRQEATATQQLVCTSREMENAKFRYKQYLTMDSQKYYYLSSFARRAGHEVPDLFMAYIETYSKTIQGCYAEETFWIPYNEFVLLILLDAIFIIEVMLRILGKEVPQDDSVLTSLSLRNSVFRDMVLLENQLPYFVLEKLYEYVPPGMRPRRRSFRNFVFEFFGIRYPYGDRDQFKHFVDVLRYARVRSIECRIGKYTDTEMKRRSELFNVKRLQEVGVDFVRIDEEDHYSVNMVVDKRQLKMTTIWVSDGTETELKNVIALEQHHFLNEPLVSNYVLMLESLIKTEEDVRLLSQKGIIRNHVGNDDVVVQLVKNLCKGIVVESSCFCGITKQLVEHQGTFWSQVRRNFFDNYVKGAATVASAIALLLTLAQTVASIIQIWPKG